MLNTVWLAVWEAFKPMLPSLVAALVAALIAYVRNWVQRHAAVSATTIVELESKVRELTPALSNLSNPLKKQLAMQELLTKLPALFKPFTKGGLDKLVEGAVPAAKERTASLPPPDPNKV